MQLHVSSWRARSGVRGAARFSLLLHSPLLSSLYCVDNGTLQLPACLPACLPATSGIHMPVYRQGGQRRNIHLYRCSSPPPSHQPAPTPLQAALGKLVLVDLAEAASMAPRRAKRSSTLLQHSAHPQALCPPTAPSGIERSTQMVTTQCERLLASFMCVAAVERVHRAADITWRWWWQWGGQVGSG